MKLTLVPSAVALRLGRLPESAASIAKQQQALINSLYDFCVGSKAMSQAGIGLQAGQDGTALLVTPVGNARTKMGWTVSNSRLNGTLTFERERKDSSDRLYWEPIFALTIPENEPAFSTKEEGGIYVNVLGFDDDVAKALSDLVATVVYRIVMGPEAARMTQSGQ